MPRLRMLVLATAIALGASVSATAATSAAGAVNPFFSASTLPFQAPPFDKIKDSDYQPAIDEGIRRQRAEIEQIANNPQPATFENTYVARPAKSKWTLPTRRGWYFRMASTSPP